MQASPNRKDLPPRSPSKTPSPNRSGLPPSKTPSPKRNSAYNHLPLSFKQTEPLSSNKMANRLLQLAEVRKKSEMNEVPKAHTKISLDEYIAKKKAVWDQVRIINDENRCVSKHEDFITLRNLLLEFSKITPVQICSAVKGAIDSGYYVNENDHLIYPEPEYSGPAPYYNNGAPQPSAPGNYRYSGATAPPPYYSPPQPSAPPANASYYTGLTPYYNAKPSAPPANNHDPTVPRGGTKRKYRKGRKTRRS